MADVFATIDRDRLMADLFKPGMNHVSDGLRGGGKTHHAIWLSQALVQGLCPSVPKMEMLTNVIFLQRTHNGFKEGYPPHVHHVQTMEDMFRQIGMILEKDRSTPMLCVLDEVQNFLLADNNQDEVNQAFLKFYGTTRKFNLIFWMLTPSINNIVPRARNFYDDPNKPGYVNVRWRKNPQLARDFIRSRKAEISPKQLITVQMSQEHTPELMYVGSSPWTTPLDEMRQGQYGYDHMSCADFSMGTEAFDFGALMKRIGGVPYMDLPATIRGYFDDMEAKQEEEGEDNQQALRIARMREMPNGKRLTWNDISYIEDTPESTLRRRLQQAV